MLFNFYYNQFLFFINYCNININDLTVISYSSTIEYFVIYFDIDVNHTIEIRSS